MIHNVAVSNGGVAMPTPVAAVRKMALTNVRKGRVKTPVRVLLYAAEKFGKSTFAAGAPGAVFLGKDSGTEHLDIARLPQPETWKDVLEALDEVARNGKAAGYESLVVDPVNWLEPLVHLDVTGDLAVSLNDFGGGYGRGSDAANTRWRAFVAALERVWTAGLNVILLAHAHVKRYEDPEGPGYERHELAMAPKAAGLLKQWVDAVLFGRRDSFGKADNTKRVKAFGSSARIIHTEWAPAYDAGNRYTLPAELPCSWSAFAEAVDGGRAKSDALKAQIDAALVELNDAEVRAKVRGYLENPAVSLVEIANALAAKVGAKREREESKNEGESK